MRSGVLHFASLHVFRGSLLVAGFTLLFASAALAQVKSDRERARLAGPVRTVSERNVSFLGPAADTANDRGAGKARDTVTYDRSGNEIERVMISDYGEAMGTETSTLDASGRIKEKVWRNPKVGVNERKVFVYADDGKLNEILIHDGRGTLRRKTKHVYDAAGRMIREEYYDPKVLQAKTVYKYDEHGRVVETAFFMADGEKAIAPVGPCLGAHSVTLGYDALGRETARAVYEPDGKVKKSWTYTYNDRGDMLAQTVVSTFSTQRYAYKYEYDTHNNWTRATITSEDNTADHPLFAAMDRLDNRGKEKPSAAEKQKLADQLRRTTITTRVFTYY